jgi:molybdopterin synthase catalytic subunit
VREVIRLTREPFDPGEALNAFCRGREAVGAIASFVGLARGTGTGGPALELEAYPGFTEVQITAFIDEAVDRFGLHDAAVVHRIGPIGAGEAIVLVLTAATHRRAAFEACDYLMDYLKSGPARRCGSGSSTPRAPAGSSPRRPIWRT